MVNYPYLTLSCDEKTTSLRVSQLKPYINRIKLPMDMKVELTFGNGLTLHGVTSDSGFLIIFHDWPETMTRPGAGNIFQIQASKFKYWKEYDLEKSPIA